MSGIDISAIVVFHHEGPLVPATIRSLAASAMTARGTALRVELIAILDRPDVATLACVQEFQSVFDLVEIVDCGDLGASRNSGSAIASGKYVAFLDGDDLWGDRWLVEGFRTARDAKGSGRIIWHPQFIFYFSEQDYGVAASGLPADSRRSFFFRQVDSDSAGFDPRALLFNNVWTANCFAERDLHLAFPYRPVNVARGLGVEDWSWHGDTLVAGCRHGIVDNAVHCVRLRADSLGATNTAKRLLPTAFHAAKALEDLWAEKN